MRDAWVREEGLDWDWLGSLDTGTKSLGSRPGVVGETETKQRFRALDMGLARQQVWREWDMESGLRN